MSDAQSLYDSMVGEAHKFASVSTLSVEDVRQTLYLMCLERAAGIDGYNPLVGSERAYIMGRMWGLVERWRAMRSLEDEEMETAQAPSVEESLITVQQRQVEELIRNDLHGTAREALPTLPTMVALVAHRERTVREVTRRWGVESGHGRKKLSEAVRKIAGQ